MTIQQAFGKALRIVLVDLAYPYAKRGKGKVYMNSSLFNVAARFIALGHTVRIIDFNLDRYEDSAVQQAFRQADFIGISVVGCPYIPNCLRLVCELKSLVPDTPILLGGQTMKGLGEDQFAEIFVGTQAIQVRNDNDIAELLGVSVEDVPSPYVTPMQLAWEALDPVRLKTYLATEFSLVLSQNCIFGCTFCAAPKNQAEQHVDLDVFESDLRYLVRRARQFGLDTIRTYLSSLDTFQNPATIAKYLEIMARIRKETEFNFQSRCLSCTKSLVRAYRQVPNLGNLIHKAGLYCIGFGIDGTKDVWKEQNKEHNTDEQILECFQICHQMGIEFEALLVTGFAKQNFLLLLKMLWNSIKYVYTWPGITIRPYVEKHFIPGNEAWKESGELVEAVVHDPDLFYNLDFAACASKATHPIALHRLWANVFYLGMIGGYSLIGRCPNNPLFPQGGRGLGAALARKVNRLMPYDR